MIASPSTTTSAARQASATKPVTMAKAPSPQTSKRSTSKINGVRGVKAGKQKLEATVSIDLEAGEIYNFWRDFTNVPVFMQMIKEVEIIDETRSRWRAKGPYDTWLSWEAELINDRPGELISWESVGKTKFQNAGSVRFTPLPKKNGQPRTEVRLVADFSPPGGPVGAFGFAMLMFNPQRWVEEDLRSLKTLLEGEEDIEARKKSMLETLDADRAE